MSVTKLIAGKHSCVGHFSAGEYVTDGKRLEKKGMLVYVGKFQSMDGEVDLTEQHIDLLIANHNHRVAMSAATSTAPELHERGMPPLQLDHSTSARDTVGRVVGNLFKGSYLNKEGITVPALMAEKIVVLGSENVEKVVDGRWCNVSIGADLEKGELNELSITPFPAAPNASLLSQGGKMETKEQLKARHLAEKEALSAAHGDELKTHKLEEVKGKHEQQLAALAEKHAEELKKLGVEPPKEGQLSDDVKEEEKKLAAAKIVNDAKLAAADASTAKLTAAKPKLIELSKKISVGMKTSRLAAREQMMTAKIARLRASAKITPAEQKKINLTELAGKPDAEVDAFFKGYEIRENVIDTRFHGTTKALSLGALSKMTKEKRGVRLEAEARHDLGMPMNDEQKKEMESAMAGPSVAPVMPGNEEKEHDEMMSALSSMLASYDQRDAVLAHVKKMMGLSHLGEMPPEQAEKAEKQMSALVNDFNRLQTEVQEFITLIGDATGIQKSELTG